MSRQDKSTTERHAKTLKELVRRPENKVCADCKRNDPRWASWNLGVFLCIRCSGIHRSMGTHISKVKSVDLDIWTPEQMQSIMKWGNQRANAYWEAHLKAGHIPPDHKMDSFIRSKYDSRRWAMEGPPPSDPSVLDNVGQAVSAPAPVEAPTPPPTQNPPQQRRAQAQQPTQQQPQPHRLLSLNHQTQQPVQAPSQPVPATQPTPQPQAPAQPVNDLFSLDFHAPTPPPQQASHFQGSSIAKNDIMSLFNAAPPPAQVPVPPNVWGQPAAPQQQQQQQPISMMGTSGAGMWGASSGWSAPQQPQQSAFGQWAQPAQPTQPAPLSDPFGNVWGNSTSNAASGGSSDLFGASALSSHKKDDVFGDLWGSSR